MMLVANFILLSSIISIVIYRRFCLKTRAFQDAPPAVAFRLFTPTTLLNFDGVGDKPVYIVMRGHVFDVTRGKMFYRLDGPYENFAGRDASQGLVMQSFEDEILTENLKEPLDDLRDLDTDQLENLDAWEALFLEKYPVVGKLVADNQQP